MLASILNFILYLIFLYLILYGIYLLTINLKALISTNAYIKENSQEKFKGAELNKNKLCVIIFANSKSRRLEPLLSALNDQTYDKENYSVHCVFAKDSNSLLYTPDCIAGAQIHCIENAEFFKKNKALNLFIEKIITTSKFDAYVFLGADRYVMSDYLENVNIALNERNSSVITGKTTVVPEFKNHLVRAKVLEAKQEFKNNTTNIARKMFELASVIDSDNLVVRADILEKTGRICFETREDELKYSLFLASNGIKPVYSPFIETIVEAEYYNPITAGFGVRFALFRYYSKLLFKKPWYFVEFVLSMLQPNVAVTIALYLILLYSSFNFISSIGIKYILHLGIFYILVWALGFIASKLNPIKAFLFLLYPFYSFAFNFRKITKDISKRALLKTIAEEKNVKSATMDAYVTDGKKNVMCKMDLISEDGMRRVILRFRKKRVISDESIRMYDAISNMSKKIHSHGFALKICQNCVHFNSVQDGTVDLLRGTCSCLKNENGDDFETLIWNRCENFKLKPEENIMETLNNN